MSLIGKTVYHLFHKPAGHINRCLREGGPLEQWKTRKGRIAMQEAAGHLHPLPAGGPDDPYVYFLTGSRFWDQTLFCLHSWYASGGCRVRPVIYDDGTLTASQKQLLDSKIPGSQWIAPKQILDCLDPVLPADQFPFLRGRREHYPNIRKLTDVHILGSDWKLVLDSDLLFFREPEQINQWLKSPSRPLYAIDMEESYGYPRDLMESLCGAVLPHRLNVGVCGLNSGEIDWEKIEFWTKSLIEKHGPHYYLEQALVAMLVANRDCEVLPSEDYITGPVHPEANQCAAVMHHYVADSKKWYFRENWRKFTGEC